MFVVRIEIVVLVRSVQSDRARSMDFAGNVRNIRLTSSWYFRCDFMGVYPEYVVRRVRNEFLVKHRLTEAAMTQRIAELCKIRA